MHSPCLYRPKNRQQALHRMKIHSNAVDWITTKRTGTQTVISHGKFERGVFLAQKRRLTVLPSSIALRRHRLYRQVFGGSLPDLPAPAHVQSLGAVQSGQNEATPGQEQRNVKEQDPLSTLYQFEDWEEKSLRNTFCSQSTGHDHDHSDGHFAPAPLRVDHGVALTEESLELKVPDVITQL